VLFQSEDITRARSAFSVLNTLGVWLPVVAIVLLVTGVYVAADHRRALAGAGAGLAASMVVLALGLAVFRSIYLDSVPAAVLPHDAAAVLYDTIVRFLRLGLRTVLVLAPVVAAAAFLTGPSVSAVRTRAGLAGAIGWGSTGPGSRPGGSGPGSRPTSGPCASAPSPWPAWPWCSGGGPPARSCSASPWPYWWCWR
jgi:hypothetical protein